MSLKNERFFAHNLCAAFLFSGVAFFTQNASAQVPVNTPGKQIELAYANETAGSAGTIESLHSYSENDSKTVTVITVKPIPFGTEAKVILDMKGYDQQFTRSFTFTNSSSTTYTINNVDFENKNSKFDFVAIGTDDSFPLDVAPGQTFTVKVAFRTGDRNKLYSDRILFQTEQTKTPIAYQIQALQQPMSDMPWNKKTASK
jgi:hypothetical protein